MPEFGIRRNPDWENVFWIGDAAGSIPPISGEGLAIGITSGWMAAEHFLHSNPIEFKKAWLKSYSRRFLAAKFLHHLMLHPATALTALKMGHTFPKLPPLFWKWTRV